VGFGVVAPVSIAESNWGLESVLLFANQAVIGEGKVFGTLKIPYDAFDHLPVLRGIAADEVAEV
jgi:hypothetical protein